MRSDLRAALSSEKIDSLDARIDFGVLNELIEHHLLNAMVETERPETVIETVMQEYEKDLRLSGKIPAAFLDDVLEELREIVLEIIRKRTYGCVNIATFKDQFKESR